MSAIENTALGDAEPRVRAGEPRDLDAIAEVYAHYVRHSVVTFEQQPPDRTEWARRFTTCEERGWPFLVAVSGTEVLGYAYVAPWRDRPAYRYTVENSVYVRADSGGRGLGRALLTGLLTGCRAAGLQEVIAVIVDSGDPASIALHRHCGFAEAGRLVGVGHKHGRTLDTVLMQHRLSYSM